MYKYTYLTGALIIFPIWLILFLFRKDLRKEMIFLGILIGIGAPIIEFVWFLKDYWYPLKYISVFNFVWQEMIFGFFLGGIGSIVYEVLFRKREKKGKFNLKYFLLSIGIIALSFFIFTNLFHLNSIYSNFIAFVLVLILIFIKRPDLTKDSLISGIFIGIIAILGYLSLILIWPNLINDLWLLRNTSNILIIGIPIEEMVWFFLFGLLIGPLYEFWKTKKE